MMNNPIRFTDERFQPQNSGACHLLIHLNPDSYSYAIIDKKEDRLSVLFKKYFPLDTDAFSPFNRLEILRAENENVKLDFSRVKISVETRAFTFIPEGLFSTADLSHYSKFIGAAPKTVLLNSEIKSLSIKNISAIELDLENNLRKVFNDPLIFSQVNPFVAGICNLLEMGSKSELFINFNIGSFEACIIKNGSFEFYNIFDISTADEFNYFLLNLISQLKINLSLAVTLSGEIDNGNEMYQRIKKYFGQIFFADTPFLSNRPDYFKKAAFHQVFSLISLDLCG